MSDTDEPTATDERAAQNQNGAPIVPINRDADDTSLDPTTGAPAGQILNESSPLDTGDQTPER